MYKILIAIALFSFWGCDFKKVEEGNAPKQSAMKCGAGKCGASMIDDNSVLEKKKKNILAQMRSDDTRKKCVQSARTTKTMYDCLRDKNTKRLTKKCASEMKCGAGKCGSAMKKETPKENTMKCGAGKCGAVKIDTH